MADEPKPARDRGQLSLSDEGLILDADDLLYDLVGYDKFALTGCQFEFVLTKASSIFFHLYLHALTRLKRDAQALHLVLRALDGSEIPVTLKIQRANADGGTGGYSCELQVRPDP